jgi:hypothetical protein
MDYQRDHLSLNGAWQTLAGHGQEEAFRPEIADRLPGWQERTIPGGLADRDVPSGPFRIGRLGRSPCVDQSGVCRRVLVGGAGGALAGDL